MHKRFPTTKNMCILLHKKAVCEKVTKTGKHLLENDRL